MKLLVGLGNPTPRYSLTRHNAGFICLDDIAAECGVEWAEKKSFQGLWGRGEVFQTACLFLKPQTYMNNSGVAVAAVAGFYKVATSDVIVIHDDLDVPSGKVKSRIAGSSGGHNGVQSVINHLHSGKFHRIKLGVAKQVDNEVSGESWVLNDFSVAELKVLRTEMKEQVLVRLQQIFKASST